MKKQIICALLAAAATCGFAQGTAFTYQGRLNDGGGAANGLYDLRFKLFVDPLGNNQAGSTLLTNGVPVANGLFVVTLDFGAGIFTGTNYWLEVDVKTNGAVAYANLNPLQAVTPTPYAMFAESVAGGALAPGTYTNPVTLNNPGNSFTGTFIGNGAGVSNVNALTLNGLDASGFWQLGGNNVTGGQFIGSINNQPVEIWANGTRAMRFEPNTNGAPNVVGGAPVNYVDPGIVGATIAGGGNVSGNYYLGGGSNHVAAIFGTIAGGRANTVAADHAFIGGGISNTVQTAAYDSVVGGGVANVIATNASESVLAGGTCSYSFIGGGSGNSIQTNAYVSVIGGGSGNSIQPNSTYSVISGGSSQSIQTGASSAFIGGGYNNSIKPNSAYTFLGGGYFNSIQANAYDAVLVGGSGNSIQTNASYAFLGGGSGNTIQTNASYSVLGGGNANTVQTNATYAFLGGGAFNTIRSNATYAVINGGDNNTIETNSQYASIAGGYGNFSSGEATVVAGGFGNINTADLSGIGSGFLNRNGAQFGTVGGGSANTNGGYAGTIGGGQNNANTGYAATIGGGQQNRVTSQTATVAGGWANLANGFVATVSGGYSGQASGDYSTVAGGYSNTVNGAYGFVGGGSANAANGAFASVGGGSGNTAANRLATVGGGVANSATGYGATVAGGYLNSAGGDYSFAAGKSANAAGNRSFVWNSFANPNYAVGSDEFFIFATNGFSIDYNNQTAFGGGDRWVYIGKGTGGFGVPATISTWTSAYLSDGGAWSSASDRAKKENFAPVDTQAVLAKVVDLPIQTWNYTNESPAIRHLGPVSQDFHAAFGLNGADDKHISDVDEAGVALAAIQGLNQKEEANRAALRTRAAELDELKAQNRELNQRVTQLEAIVSSLTRSAP